MRVRRPLSASASTPKTGAAGRATGRWSATSASTPPSRTAATTPSTGASGRRRQGLPRTFAGPHSEKIGGLGALPYDEMRDYLRRIRAYLYTGTQPASYTLGLIEAMMTGVPVVSIGPDHMTWQRDLFEGHEIAIGRSDDPASSPVLRSSDLRIPTPATSRRHHAASAPSSCSASRRSARSGGSSSGEGARRLPPPRPLGKPRAAVHRPLRLGAAAADRHGLVRAGLLEPRAQVARRRDRPPVPRAVGLRRQRPRRAPVAPRHVAQPGPAARHARAGARAAARHRHQHPCPQPRGPGPLRRRGRRHLRPPDRQRPLRRAGHGRGPLGPRRLRARLGRHAPHTAQAARHLPPGVRGPRVRAAAARHETAD
jgi:hypothetical protein